jgi:molecular chaperone DnaK (HSP70)
MTHWALDLGTTNTGIARWDAAQGRPRMVELPELCRKPDGGDPLEAPSVVPSAVHVLEPSTLWDRLGLWPPVARRLFLGRQALIGRPALEQNQGPIHPNYAPSFKRFLGGQSLRTLARAGSRTQSARDVARLFLRELLAEIRRATSERLRELTLTSPVEAYEAYRAELTRIGKDLGIRRLRFVDEPVAAALGYGLGIERDRVVLVVDFGGGTLDLALVALSARRLAEGTCRVLAKEGRPLGGNDVDRWLLGEFCRKLDYPLAEDAEERDQRFWYRLMLAEACRVKESLFFRESDRFYVTPPEEIRRFEAQLRGEAAPLEVTRDDLVEILHARGLYHTLERCLDGVLEQASAIGLGPKDVHDVLMVGGSTLLPGVYPLFEERFGRDRVRAWQPFEAVAYGACVLAAGGFEHSDFIVHDYAFVTHDSRTNERQYNVIVPRGTRFPTPPDFWKRQLVPTCSLGEPETIFKLVICEIGRGADGERSFVWDAAGRMHKLGGRDGGEERLVVPLNDASPALGHLDPPHSPSDRRPRLEVAFGISSDRWLCATVLDLKTQRLLMRDEAVVRLL